MIETFLILNYIQDDLDEDFLNLNDEKNESNIQTSHSISESTYQAIRISGTAMAIFGNYKVRLAGLTTLAAIEAYKHWKHKEINQN